MRFAELAGTLERLEGISSGNEMRKVLSARPGWLLEEIS